MHKANEMAEEQSLKEKTAKGIFWGGLSNGMQQLLNLLFGIFLARLLSPGDYGMVGMLTVFSAIASALQEGGFIAALTNRKDISHRDYNAVFWFSTTCSLCLYVLLFFSAPLIAGFFKSPELIPLSRFLFLGFVISSLNITPRAYLFKNLKVKENTIISIISLCISGTGGILLAANGFAYWGIAGQSILYVSTATVLSFYFSRWKPSFRFDFTPIKEMITFSSKLIVSNIFNIINNNLFSVLLGRFYTRNDVGNFTQANKWNIMGYSLISGIVSNLAQPVFSRVTDDKVRQLAIFRKIVRFTAFFSFPLMFGLGFIAKEFIVITIGEKWLPCAAILQLLCIGGAFIPISNPFYNLLISRGRSDIFMWGSIGLCTLQLLTAYILHPYGLTTMLYAFVSIIIGWIFFWYGFVRKEIGLRLRDVLKDLLPYLLLSLLSIFIAGRAVAFLENIYWLLLAKIVLVAGLYFLSLWLSGSVIFKESMEFLLKRKI